MLLIGPLREHQMIVYYLMRFSTFQSRVTDSIGRYNPYEIHIDNQKDGIQYSDTFDKKVAFQKVLKLAKEYLQVDNYFYLSHPPFYTQG